MQTTAYTEPDGDDTQRCKTIKEICISANLEFTGGNERDRTADLLNAIREKTARYGYIKPANYERSKARKYKSNMHLRENMPYDKELDEYRCPNGKS
jgi:hypothetical protein